jgi:hypothetical protein
MERGGEEGCKSVAGVQRRLDLGDPLLRRLDVFMRNEAVDPVARQMQLDAGDQRLVRVDVTARFHASKANNAAVVL